MSARRAYPGQFVPALTLGASQSVPSGQPVELFEVLIDELGGETWLRFRFIAPQIAHTENPLSFDQVQTDFEHLCAFVAVPYMDEFTLEADLVVITLLDRHVDFGVSDPDAVQLIEAFRVDGGLCEWEGLL